MQILANVASREANLEFWYTWISIPDEGIDAGWKLHDIRLPEIDADLNWFSTIAEATSQFHDANDVISSFIHN